MDAARKRWLAANPFLIPLAHFRGLVDGAAGRVEVPAPALPPAEAHAAAYAAGVALLRGPTHGPPVLAAGSEALRQLLERVAELRLPRAIAEGVAEVRGALAEPGPRGAALAWVVEADPATPAPVQGGLLRLLGWAALGRLLGPAAAAFQGWRDDAAWGRPTCPTCGALPVMALVVGEGAAEVRSLACGCCATRWGYRPRGCPHCGNEAVSRLARLALAGPAKLRLDVCESCRGYLKTCAGEGEASLFLADWPTLALDAMAAERGYVRRGVSLYEL